MILQMEDKLMLKVGDKVEIIEMQDNPSYSGKSGIVERIDSIGQIHGTWGGLALIPGLDTYKLIKEDTE